MSSSQNPIAAPSARLVIDGGNIPFGAYQAIYHQITKKIEKLYKEHNDAYDIHFSDIQDLHLRLEQLISQYQVKGKSVEINHSLSESQTRTYSSFEKFKISDVTTRSCTKKINYSLDFLVVLPAEIPEAEDIAQRFKVDISLYSPKQSENGLAFAPAMFRFFGLGDSIDVTIEYSDYSVAIALQAVIDSWVANLKSRKTSTIIKALSSLDASKGDIVIRMIAAVPFFSAFFFIVSKEEFTVERMLHLLFFVIGISVFFSGLSLFLWRKVVEGALSLIPSTRIYVTSGDEVRHAEEGVGFKKTISVISSITALAASVSVKLFSALIFSVLK